MVKKKAVKKKGKKIQNKIQKVSRQEKIVAAAPETAETPGANVAPTVQTAAPEGVETKAGVAGLFEAKAVKKEVEEVHRENAEENKMTESKGVGKDYDPSEFSKPAAEMHSSSNSKTFLYVGLSVALVAILVVGVFVFGGFGKAGSDSASPTGATTVTAYCSDTDGGYNRFTKGVAEGTYYLDYSSGQFMDECAAGEDNKLTEYYCKNNLVVYATEPCPDGLTCADGICA